jgi:hypothetical protein
MMGTLIGTMKRLAASRRRASALVGGSRLNGRRWAIALLAAGLLILCHGCHGDEDHELFGTLLRNAGFPSAAAGPRASDRLPAPPALLPASPQS